MLIEYCSFVTSYLTSLSEHWRYLGIRKLPLKWSEKADAFFSPRQFTSFEPCSKGLSSHKVVRNCLHHHFWITYAATVTAYVWGFQFFAYVPACADLCTFLWPPPFLPHEGGVYSMAHLGKYKKKQFATALILAQKHHLTMHPKLLESLNHPGPRADECHSKESQRNEGIPQKAYHGDSLRGCITFTK